MERKNETVLITGASSGIGLEFARIFAQNGYDMVFVARNKERMEELKTELGKDVNITIITEDLSEYDAPKRIYAELKDAGIQIEILINNAGFGLEGEFIDIDIERQMDMIRLNVIGMTQMAYYFAKDMATRGHGKILNTGSISSFMPTPLMSIYSATKAFILSFSRSLNSELKLQGDISVTALCPGPVRTNFSNIAGVRKWMKFFNQFYSSPDYIAQIGYKALMKKRNVVSAGMGIPCLVFVGKISPMKWVDSIMWKLAKPDKSKLK